MRAYKVGKIMMGAGLLLIALGFTFLWGAVTAIVVAESARLWDTLLVDPLLIIALFLACVGLMSVAMSAVLALWRGLDEYYELKESEHGREIDS